jgi:hypothetical protein
MVVVIVVVEGVQEMAFQIRKRVMFPDLNSRRDASPIHFSVSVEAVFSTRMYTLKPVLYSKVQCFLFRFIL